ncbi:MAG: hypothetical protein ACKVQA_04200, partial [Burkholderiales bacterium]
MHEFPDLSRLSVAEKDALILAQFEQLKQVARLTAMVQALNARIRERVATPDVIVHHRLPEHCEGCGTHLGAQTGAWTEDRRQVFDLLKPVLQVTEHRGYETVCRCGRRHRSVFP